MQDRAGVLVVAVLAYAASVAACVGDSNPIGNDGGDGSSSDAVIPETTNDAVADAGPQMYGRFAYAANGTDGTITAYAADGTSGWLRIAGYSMGGKNSRLAIDPSGKHLYVASATDSSITMFSIGTDGSLPFTSTPQSLGAVPSSVAIEPTGHYLYVATSTGVHQFSIDGAGAMSALSPSSVPCGASTLAHSLAVDPSGKYAYVAASDGLIYQFGIGGNGVLAPLSSPTLTAGAGSQSIAIDPTGKHAYVTAKSDNTVYQYNIGAGGALSAIGTLGTGGGPVAVTVDPSGRYAYVANHDDSTVSQFTINAQGALSAMTAPTAATGSGPQGVTIDGSGRFVYTENSSEDTVGQLLVGPNGALTMSRTVRTRDNPTSFVISSGTSPLSVKLEFAYASSYYASDAGANIGQYAIGSSGALSGVGVAQANGSAGRFIATNAAGSYLYVSNLLSASISQYSVGSTGTLTALTPTYAATGVGPIGISIDPNGRYLYDVNYYSNNVSAFSIAAGKLTGIGSPLATGSSPVCVSLDPTGRFLYASNSDSQATGSPGPNTSLSSYVLADPSTGLATAGTTIALTNDKIWCVAVDPTGKYAYAVNNDAATGTIYQYKIDTTGALLPLSPATVTTGIGAGIFAFDPYGRFAYVVNGGGNTVSQYSINAGLLQPLSPATVSTGQGPTSITVDIAGQHAYVTNATDNEISQYALDGTTGALSQITPSTVADYAGSYPTSITTTGVIQ